MSKAIELCLPILNEFEGCRLDAYTDQGGKVTIGWGSTTYPDGRPVQLGDKWSQQQCDERRDDHLKTCENQIKKMVKVPLKDNQIAALLDFTYNLGAGNLNRSGLLKKINRSEFTEAAEEFLKWVYIGSYKSKGLTRRREAERKLFLM